MRFLVDNALSPDLAALLAAAGHDAQHVRTLGLRTAEDTVILRTAIDRDRVLISADTDFGTLVTLSTGALPSVILFRQGVPRRPSDQAALLLTNLPSITDALESGALVVFRSNRIRVRPFRHSG